MSPTDKLTLAECWFADALARHRFRPLRHNILAERCQVMIFGGAGAGKSTISNMLIGTTKAESNPQAGYTRHPTIYFVGPNAPIESQLPPRIGTLVKLDGDQPANIDRDVYTWHRFETSPNDFLRRHAVWDGPDLTSRHAEHYEMRSIEIAALADLCVYVASDERYNDELPTNFLQAMLEAGKKVIVVLTKVNADEADELKSLFESQVMSKLKHAEHIVGICVVPFPGPGKIAKLATEELPYAGQVRDTVTQASKDLVELRRQSVQSAGQYLRRLQPRLLEPLQKDVGEFRQWMELVRQAANQAVQRYQAEFLGRIHYDEFDQTKAAMHELLVPNDWSLWLHRGLEFVRMPFRQLRAFLISLTPLQPRVELNEKSAIDQVRREMVDGLQLECSSRRHRHSFWA